MQLLTKTLNIINMSKIRGAIVVNTERCKGCSLCVVACPKKVIELTTTCVNVQGYAYAEAVRPDECTGCASCGIVCPDGCITVYKKKMEE
jgi:2-oxoglutarate ferredoxin oxidoreductase subunit delta